MKVINFLLLPFALSLAADLPVCFPEATEYETQLQALKQLLPEVDNTTTVWVTTSTSMNKVLMDRYEKARLEAAKMIVFKYDTNISAAFLLFGDWSVERIGHVKTITADGPIEFEGRRYLTIADAARFLPEGWTEVTPLVKLVKEIVISKIIIPLGRFYWVDIEATFADFSEARISHLAKIFVGDWKYCPYRDASQMSLEMKSFYHYVIEKRAQTMFECTKDFVEQDFFYHFTPGRVELIRSLLLNEWINRPVTMEELERLFGGVFSMAFPWLDAFAFKTFVAHRLFTLEARLRELMGHAPLSPAELQDRKLKVIGSEAAYTVCCHHTLVSRNLEAVQAHIREHGRLTPNFRLENRLEDFDAVETASGALRKEWEAQLHQ